MTHGSRRRFPLAPCVIGSRIHRETLDGHASLVSLRRRTRVVLPFRHALDIFSSLPVSDWPQKSWLTRYFRRFRHRQSWNLLDRVRREAIVFFSFRRGESLRISRDNWIPSSSQHNFGLDYRSLLADIVCWLASWQSMACLRTPRDSNENLSRRPQSVKGSEPQRSITQVYNTGRRQSVYQEFDFSSDWRISGSSRVSSRVLTDGSSVDHVASSIWPLISPKKKPRCPNITTFIILFSANVSLMHCQKAKDI